LYKIQSVSYDIIASDQPQVTDISMLAYYYHDERFENLDETTATENDQKAEESSSNNENHGTSKKDNSD
jgi:outer membrane usher protein FimD/PapC